MTPFFKKAEQAGQPHVVFLYDVIGETFWEDGLTAKAVVMALADIEPDDDLLVRVNCLGGNLSI